MRTLRTFYVLAFFLACLPAFCQSYGNTAYIEVSGTAEKEIIPDQIYISMVIREKYSGKIKITIEEQEEKLKSSIRSLGIDLANLSLSDANADYVRVRWSKKDVLTKKDYILMVSDATTVGQVFAELEKLEITDASISRVSHSRMDSLKKEIRIMAIKDAKEKADYLLAAIGEQTGKALIVKENDGSGTTFRGARSEGTAYYIDGVRVVGKVKLNEEEGVEFQKIRIKVEIYVKFSIK